LKTRRADTRDLTIRGSADGADDAEGCGCCDLAHASFRAATPWNPELEAGKAESELVPDYFRRPITKARNSIGMASLGRKDLPRRQPGEKSIDRADFIRLPLKYGSVSASE